ncbi:MAG: hypothetical protein Q7U45_01930, partial [Burkholderiaceae bacterium]|nr:hypothetical protein [Burkholderiaceae bacterium]
EPWANRDNKPVNRPNVTPHAMTADGNTTDNPPYPADRAPLTSPVNHQANKAARQAATHCQTNTRHIDTARWLLRHSFASSRDNGLKSSLSTSASVSAASAADWLGLAFNFPIVFIGHYSQVTPASSVPRKAFDYT